MTIVEPARAKLNLALHVRARRPDGFHEIETLFAFTRDGDTVTVAPADTPSFAVTGPFAGDLATDSGNLVLRARDAFAARFGRLPPLAITLDKHLPVASGIGGGSADAAATLRALARLRGVAPDALVDVAGELGSDVPACLSGETAVGTGRGERLTPLTGLAGTPCVLVNPGVAVATPDVFAGWDGVDRGALPDGDARRIAQIGRNDLEMAARALAPAIGEVLATLRMLDGAWLVRMSGSGATSFALFDRSADLTRLRAQHPGWWCLETVLA